MTDLIAAKVTGVAAAGSAIASVFAAVTDAVAISAITSVAAVLMAGVSAYFAYKAKTISEGTHKAVNSRLTELLELTRKSTFAEGVQEEKKQQMAREAIKESGAQEEKDKHGP